MFTFYHPSVKIFYLKSVFFKGRSVFGDSAVGHLIWQFCGLIPCSSQPPPLAPLKDVIQTGSIANWQRLMKFAMALRQPSRGGRRFNLTGQIMAPPSH